MSRKTLVFVCVILGLLVFLGGCAVQVPVPVRVLLARFEDEVLDEDWYVAQKNIAIGKTGRVYGYINLTHWTGDYGLEILFMTMDSFAAYDGGESFSAWHQSFYTVGRHYFEFKNVPPGNYALVVDNTDLGWEDTDFDFVNDYAVFDLEVYFETY
jgi:hypothetical protein